MNATIDVVDPEGEAGQQVLRAYWDDIISSYHGRPATEAEISDAVTEWPSDMLAPPQGFFLIARDDDRVLGCIGLWLRPDTAGKPDQIGEVKRVFVAPVARGQGIGGRLFEALEQRARERGVSWLRLDTRHDMTDAHRLYSRQGFDEIPAFNDDEYAHRWLGKTLA